MASPAASILIVDDEVNILNALTRVLRQRDVEVVTTSSPFEALHLASKQTFSVIISDQKMPHMDGNALLERIRDIQPDAVRILMTGYADAQIAKDAINRGQVYRFLSKPWGDELFLSNVDEALQHYSQLLLQKEDENKQQAHKEVYQDLIRKSVMHTQEMQNMNRELERTSHASINMLIKLMKMSNLHLWHHSRRMVNIALMLGRMSGMSRADLEQLEVAVLLHDIGKLGLPAYLLRKKERLFDETERETIRKHPLIAAQLVANIGKFSDSALIIRHHHENFDGSGYPEGLAGSNIPLGSRIIAVVDHMEGLIGASGKQTPTRLRDALREIESGSGTTFDPKVLSMLKRYIQLQKGDGGKGQAASHQVQADLWHRLSESYSYPSAEVVMGAGEMQDASLEDFLPAANPEPIGPGMAISSEMELAAAPESSVSRKMVENKRHSQLHESELLPPAAQAYSATPYHHNGQLPGNISMGTAFPEIEFDETGFQLQGLPDTDVNKVQLPDEGMLSPEEWASFVAGGLDLSMAEGDAIAPGDGFMMMDDIEPSFSSGVSGEEFMLPDMLLSESAPSWEPGPSAPPVRQSRAKATGYYGHGGLPAAPRGKKLKEECIHPRQLRVGMVTSRDLISQNGVKLLPAKSLITPEKINLLRRFMENDPPENGIYVYKGYLRVS